MADAATTAPADTAYSDWSDRGIDLDLVVVTATRTPKPLSKSPIPVQIISANDIRRIDETSVQGILQRELPGVEFSYSMNMQINMNMAGFAGQSVLFLVDGERMAGETNDNIDFERLVANDIDHIEIVKGAASALYGSSANGGVINVITRDLANGPDWTLNANGRIGSHGERRYALNWGLRRKTLANTAQLTYHGNDCYQVHSQRTEALPLIFDYVPGQEVWTASDRLTYRPNDRVKLTGRLNYYRRQMVRKQGESEHTRYYDYAAGLRGNFKLGVADALEVAYNFDQYDKTRYYVPSKLAVSDRDVREYSNVQNSWRALWTHPVEDGTLAIGTDYLYDYLVNIKLGNARYHQSSFDAFAQYDRSLGDNWEVVGALRYDFFEIGHRSQLTPKVSLAWHKEQFKLRTSYGMGFRAPSLKELYYDFEAMPSWYIDGNSELKPEHSHNFTLAADYAHGSLTYTLLSYYNRINDRLTTGVPQALADGAHLAYTNLRLMSITGGEASILGRWDSGWRGKLAYSYTYEHNPDQAPNQFMPARPHALNYSIGHSRTIGSHYSWTATLSGRWLASVYNDEYRSTQHPEEGIMRVHYPAYHLHTLQLVQRWDDYLSLTFSIDNLLGYKPDNYFYNAPLTTGQSYSLSLSIDIDKAYRKWK
ncbi:MAG: TonB-dependent receptor [Bacteroidales bacterium]|nr:TonB-dependent receptor [Bacteroidales bacterium]